MISLKALVSVAPYLLMFSILFAALLAVILSGRARVTKQPFQPKIAPVALASHFVLSLVTVAAERVYRGYQHAQYYGNCQAAGRKLASEGADAVPACNPYALVHMPEDKVGFIAYVVMTCALSIGLYHLYVTRFERVRNEQA